MIPRMEPRRSCVVEHPHADEFTEAKSLPALRPTCFQARPSSTIWLVSGLPGRQTLTAPWTCVGCCSDWTSWRGSASMLCCRRSRLNRCVTAATNFATSTRCFRSSAPSTTFSSCAFSYAAHYRGIRVPHRPVMNPTPRIAPVFRVAPRPRCPYGDSTRVERQPVTIHKHDAGQSSSTPRVELDVRPQCGAQVLLVNGSFSHQRTELREPGCQ